MQFIPSTIALKLAKKANPSFDGRLTDLHRLISQNGSWLVAGGCKLYSIRRGAVSRFALAGYAHDGQDVKLALDMAASI